jgi:predicted phage-related endonuclease
VQDEGFDSYATRWGTEVEPFAREAYELATGHFVEQVAFVDHPLHPFVGVSPDGLIGDDGGLEMKAPKNSQIHLQRFDTGMPDEFIPQVQGCMWVTGRKWWDFVSYDPRMPEKLRMLRLTIKRDDVYIARLEASVLEAEIAVAAIVEKFNRRMSV